MKVFLLWLTFIPPKLHNAASMTERSGCNGPRLFCRERERLLYLSPALTTNDNRWCLQSSVWSLLHPEKGVLWRRSGPRSIPPCQSAPPPPTSTHTGHVRSSYSGYCVIAGGSTEPPIYGRNTSSSGAFTAQDWNISKLMMWWWKVPSVLWLQWMRWLYFPFPGVRLT